MNVLYVTPQASLTTAALAEAATTRGVAVVTFTSPADIRPGDPHLYGGPVFCAEACRHLPVRLIEPTDDWLPNLPWQFRLREIQLMALSEAQELHSRHFVKAPREKDFEAGVYSGAELPRGARDDPMLLVSDVVSFVREYRLLVLDGEVVTGSRYMTSGRVDVRPLAEDLDAADVLAFARQLVDDQGDNLPSAVTLDVGWSVDAETGTEGWAVVEANMAWFSNIYACDPAQALNVIMRAAGPSARLSARDRPFVR